MDLPNYLAMKNRILGNAKFLYGAKRSYDLVHRQDYKTSQHSFLLIPYDMTDKGVLTGGGEVLNTFVAESTSSSDFSGATTLHKVAEMMAGDVRQTFDKKEPRTPLTGAQKL